MTVASVAESGDRTATLESLVVALTTAVERADVSNVPALAARLVEVLKRLGGTDPSTLVWLRGQLAPTVDRLVELQGVTGDDGEPIPEARALAGVVRQLVAVVEAIEVLPKRSVEVPKVDELAARRRAKAGAARSSAQRRDAR